MILVTLLAACVRVYKVRNRHISDPPPPPPLPPMAEPPMSKKDERHAHAAMETRRLRCLGLSFTRIARALKISTRTISRIRVDYQIPAFSDITPDALIEIIGKFVDVVPRAGFAMIKGHLISRQARLFIRV